MAAARSRLDSVMSFFASNRRSTCVRLVLSRVAMRFFDIFFSFMAWASCQATTSLTACASSKTPSSLRKSSILEPMCFLLIASTPSGTCVPALVPSIVHVPLIMQAGQNATVSEEAEKRKQQEFFNLAERFRGATDPDEVKRLGDQMGRMVFGG